MNELARTLGLVGVTLAIVGCSTPPEEPEGEGGTTSHLIADATSMERRADGDWDVVCEDGKRQVVSNADVRDNRVCQDDQRTRCAQGCTGRLLDGTCYSYGKICGADVGLQCVPQCERRMVDGTCLKYGEDFCKGRRPTCEPDCLNRLGDGTCMEFGPDYCRAN